MTSFVLIFIAFGVGLDPRQREVFGPALSPILVSLLFERQHVDTEEIGRARTVPSHLCFWHSKARLLGLK